MLTACGSECDESECIRSFIVTALHRLTSESPIAVGLCLLLAALCFRLADIFILRSDERFGEIFISKALGLVLVLLFAWSTGQGLKSIGLHSNMISRSILTGCIVTAAALGIGYALEYLLALMRGANPRLVCSAIDPKAGVTGGIFFGLWLIFGNIINSFMEEGLFRGALIRVFGNARASNSANLLQSLVFGLWHLPWTFKEFQLGKLKSIGDLAFSAVSNCVPQALTGFVWGYMYIKTNSLWAPWISHTLTNSALNLLHVKTDEGMDSGIAVRMIAYVLVMLAGVWCIKQYAHRLGFSESAP
jgi:membrane protease YdiL (CAAX protease family)